ncbi:MAG: hypothetical protein P4M14_09450 [Gammaproteobacteria bacterium]|nr:hypothetical protein [Gammaproteobacteria bacterium]
MPVIFYPQDDDVEMGSLQEKLEVLMEAAERYKAVILDTSTSLMDNDGKRRLIPREIRVAFNWQEIAKILREIRELPEANVPNKSAKADRLARLAEVYEVLRGAKMPKLEAVRIALMNESKQLRGSSGGAQVA